MEALAAFVRSEEGQIYARVNERWGTDPAAFLEAEDDVLAYNLRVGLMMRLVRSPDEEHPEAAAFRRMSGRSRQQSKQLEAMLHG